MSKAQGDSITFTRAEVADYFRARVPDLRQTSGKELRGGCPGHKGKDPNFTVEAATGLSRCFSTCDRGWDIIGLERELTGAGFIEARDEVFRLVGRALPRNGSSSDHRGSPNSPGAWREIARYPYHNAAGTLIFEVVRYLKPDGKKAFVQCRPSGVEAAGTTDSGIRGGVPTGGIVNSLDAGMYIQDPKKSARAGRTVWVETQHTHDGAYYQFSECQRVPYRLPKVLESETVFLPEGEKDVQTLESWKLTASCNPGGAGSGWRDEYTPHFRGRHCIILPDNDKPGHRHAVLVAEALLPVAASVKIVELPVGEKGDVTDWAGAGGNREQFLELVSQVSPIDSAILAALWDRWGLRGDTSATGEWPEPEPILGSLPEVEQFDPELLPAALRAWVTDIAERLQIPVDFPAATAIIELAGAIGRRALIQPKRFDDWEVVPNLWGGIVGRPGLMKSPCIRSVFRPLRKIEAAAIDVHKTTVEEFDRDLAAFEIRKNAWKARATQSAKKGGSFDRFEEQEPKRPPQDRFIINDATIEKLHAILEENPQGILYLRDELVGWLATLDSEGRERERPFFLEAWNGDGGYVMDRIGRGSVRVDNLCISLFGGLQPAKLQAYLLDAVSGGNNDDGLAQRLQVLVWPDTSPEWEDIDRLPDSAAEQAVDSVMQSIVKISPTEPLRFRFNTEAQELFSVWRKELEVRLRKGNLSPAMESHLAKYRSLMPSLAVISHMADGNFGPEIPLLQAQRAADWCVYLESHARRAYACVASHSRKAAASLGEKIRAGALGVKFSVREVYRNGWEGLETPESARTALEQLEEDGWIRKAAAPSRGKGGRPSEQFDVNPAVFHG
jgi:putative DNA primase/helicase